MHWVLLSAAISAGMLLTVQAGVNSTLARVLGNPVHGSLMSFLIGSVALLVYSTVRWSWPDVSRGAHLPVWIWTGGLLGAVYVTATAILAPKLGALSWTCSILAGQLVASMLLDQMGWVGFAQQSITLPRVVGVLLVLTGVALVSYRGKVAEALPAATAPAIQAHAPIGKGPG